MCILYVVFLSQILHTVQSTRNRAAIERNTSVKTPEYLAFVSQNGKKILIIENLLCIKGCPLIWRRARDPPLAPLCVCAPRCTHGRGTRCPAAKSDPPDRFLNAASNPFDSLGKIQKQAQSLLLYFGGGPGIRTLGPFRDTAFRVPHDRPL